MTRSTHYDVNCPVVIAKLEHQARLDADDAFVSAMKAAIARGDEKAVHGTFVDHTPPIGVRRIYGDVILSVCGSPAAMCAERGGNAAGAETMK